ncbi:MAG: AraC family ligand binding domain-containing protein, partial [Chloroflexota bacterium]
DVLVVVVAGAGVAEVDGRSYRLAPGTMLLIPRGTRRAIHSTTEALVYVSCHRRRPRLQPRRGPRGGGDAASPDVHARGLGDRTMVSEARR